MSGSTTGTGGTLIVRFSRSFPPYVAPSTSVSGVMRGVLVAMIPGLAAQLWQFGPGVLVQLSIALVVAVAAEAAVLSMRRRAIVPVLRDNSAALSAALLAVSLPPLLPWWLTVFGTLFAIVVGKQLYGGLGYNPFNPAMVGYAVLLISFPKSMNHWLPPADVAAYSLSWGDTISAIFDRSLPNGLTFDALAMATPLDTVKTRLALHESLDDIQAAGSFSRLAGKGWDWVNLGYLIGGLWLLRRRLISWQIPTAFLGTLFVSAMLFFLIDPARYPTPLFQLLTGATMVGAFFIATDPVSAATTPTGRLIYGGLIGFLIFVIRSFGGYPDGVAFAVLLMNLAAPALDYWTRPRVYGHSR